MKERGIKQNEEEKNCNIVVSTDALYKHFVCRDRRKCGGDFAGGAGTLLNESTEKETEVVPAGRIEIEEITVTDEPEDLLPEETESEEPTIRNSNLLPVNANGEVRLRSVASLTKSGSVATPV